MGVGMERHSTLFEREAEQAILGQILDGVDKGIGSVAIVEGPAGIGKSGLLKLAERMGKERGMNVGRARGAVLEQDFAFGGVRQLLGPLVAAMTDPDVVLAGAAAAARSVLGASSTEPPEGNPGSVLNGLYWLTLALAEGGPLVLLCDDAHWLDGPTLRYLAYLGHRIDEVPLALILGTRPPERGPEGDLLSRMVAEHHDQTMRLRPLSPAAIKTLVRRELTETADDNFCDAVAEASGGNPFLVAELIRSARAAGVDPEDLGSRNLAALSAGSIVNDRLGRLSPSALEVARAVAVLAGDAHIRHVAALTGMPIEQAASTADSLIRAEILGAERPLAFVHPLVGAAVYVELLPGDRSLRHRAAARLLADEGSPPASVASHLVATDAMGDPWVVGVLVDAARAAAARGATDAAITYLRRALDEPPSADSRLPILLELGMAEMLVTDTGAIEHLAEAINGFPDVPAIRTPLTVAHGVARTQVGEYRQAVAAFDELDHLIDDGDPLSLEALAGSLIVGLAGEGAALVKDRGLRLRQLVDPEDCSPLVGALRCFVGAFGNEPADSMATLAARALAAEPLDDPARWMWLHFPLTVLVMADRIDEAMARIDDGIGLARRLGAPVHIAVTLTVRAWLALRTGDLDDAEADARDAIEALELHGLDFVLAGPLGILVDVARERGDLEAAEALLERWGYTVEDGPSFLSLFLLRARGLLRAEQGRTADSVRDLERGKEHLADSVGACPAFQAWGAHLAHTLAVDPSTRGRALEEARRDLALARAFGAPRAIGVCLLAVAEVESGHELAPLEEAVETLRQARDRLNEARAMVALGNALRVHGDVERAVSVLADALDLADRRGAAPIAAAAREQLRLAGARPRRSRVAGVEALTPAERRVAGLAAAGLTNRRIAEELFLSVKTVESHLAHCYQKLGIKGRPELTAALTDGT